MANTHVTPADVKAICDKLECSPSQNQSTSNYGGKAKIVHHSGSDAEGGISGKLTTGKKSR